jgi:hypothetical protein
MLSLCIGQVQLDKLPYQGHYRENCKTVMQNLPVQPFGSVDALLHSLPSDGVMRSHYPGFHDIRTAPTTRLAEETHVATVVGQLVAVKFEDARQPGGDNDFHLIIGSSTGAYMNMEVSGLPRSGDPNHRFQDVRQQLLAILMAAHISPNTRYQKPTSQLLVRVTGSLYFDGDHEADSIGPEGFRPRTVWEIHPVQDIRLAQGPLLSGNSMGRAKRIP